MAAPWERYAQPSGPPQTAAPVAVTAAPVKNVPQVQQPEQGGFLSKLKGLGETSMNVATGGIAALGGGLNYLGTLAATGGNTGAAKAVQESTQEALTYKPRSAEGQRYAGNVGEAMSYLGQKEGEWLGEKSSDLATRMGASPEVAAGIGSALNTGTQAIPQVLGARMLKGKGAPAAAVEDAGINLRAQVDQARAAGYKLPPRMAGGNVGSVAEGMSGSAKLERGISAANQKVTQRLAREEIGLKGNAPISGGELEVLRKKHNAAYDEISKSGKIVADEDFARDMFGVGERTSQMMKDFPEAASPAIEKLRNSYLSGEFDAASAVQATRKLRADAKKYLKAFDDPEKQALGMASREIADAFDRVLERHSENIGNPKLARNFREDRTQLAKIHSVDDVLNESTGWVSANGLGKMLDRGVPLSGNLKTIAQTARRFGKAVQDTEKMPARGVEYGDLLVGGGSAGALAAAGANPIVGALAVGARPAMRGVLRSDLYQNMLGSKGSATNNMLLRAGMAAETAGAVAPREDRKRR